MLGFPVRSWQTWTIWVYFIIRRDVHLVCRGQVLKCGRCVWRERIAREREGQRQIENARERKGLR